MLNENKIACKGEADIFSNFDEYGLQRPQIIRQDINTPCFRKNNFYFDAIICDPPYGFRACSKKTGQSAYQKQKREGRINKRKEQIQKEKENEIMDDNDDDKGDKKEFDPDYVYMYGNKQLYLPLKHCEVDQIFENLVAFANDVLRKDGLLVCLYPTKRTQEENESDYLPENFPRHVNFKLERACENAFKVLKSRWCLVYRKIN